MSINEKAITALEFDKIREMLASCAPTAGASALARSLCPYVHAEQILRAQKKTTDARRLLEAKGMPPFGMVVDINPICERAQKGATLTPRELIDSAQLLRSARSLLEYIRTNKTFDSSLDEIFERLMPNRAVEDRILRSVISEDTISDEASHALSDVRRKMQIGRAHV